MKRVVGDSATLPVSWWKSSYSDTGAQCIEAAIVDDEMAALRDSKNPNGPALLLQREAVTAFAAAAASGHFDGPA
ncbi:DUF397 domain-containing protein [Streptomyces sp. B-S-A8]|uniref:DUF397 domain-containing protein n=1 Tax=Streptomyces solicavernae TaxID=3043614 RepID=A0ABT6RY24_9ACTN|nr:DUF397 domain-containing protein [Streptomyces sp. B-S-A8]MDI3389079.1 DUF397 domain-containing protein [Streptomyces sp. B-S-A8]